MTDPIVEEIHKTREEYASKFDFDIDAMFQDLREKQSNGSHKIVSFTKKEKQRRINGKKVA